MNLPWLRSRPAHQNVGAAALRKLQFLKHQRCGTFAHHQPVAIFVKGLRRHGVIIGAPAERAQPVKRCDPDAADGGLGAAGNCSICNASADHLPCRADAV